MVLSTKCKYMQTEYFFSLNGFHRKQNHIARTQAICVRARACVCLFCGILLARALSNAHAEFHLRQLRRFVPRAHGLSSAFNKKRSVLVSRVPVIATRGQY